MILDFLELPYMPEDPYVEVALQAPPSPDYVPGPEEPEQAPLWPDYVPGPKHAEPCDCLLRISPGARIPRPTAHSLIMFPETTKGIIEDDDEGGPEEDSYPNYPTNGGDNMDVEVDESGEDATQLLAYPVVVALTSYFCPVLRVD
ncbi:hypothetical protein Tco_1253659 [Tanacetum coccineum]